MSEASHIADPGLAPIGARRVEWAETNMPVLGQIRRRLEDARPFDGLRVGACLHITAESAAMMRALVAGGAAVAACASNPLSTQDDVAAALVDAGVSVHAVRGEAHADYYAAIDSVLDSAPELTMDDGCDLVSTLHLKRPGDVGRVVGGTEETTTGVIRLRAMEREGALRYPVVAPGGTGTAQLFDNSHGTGQSALDGIIRSTNVLVAGRKVVVAGFGACGKGIARRARGLGAEVVVTEVDPGRALEAALEGYRVEPMAAAAAEGDIFVTATGNSGVITAEHFATMRDGAILANAGHFDVEIDVPGLEGASAGRRSVRPMLEEFQLPGERRVLLVAEGRVVNLGAAEGHPPAVMDIAFAAQVLALEWLVARRGELEARVHLLPAGIDDELAALKLATMGLQIDRLTEAQAAYQRSWRAGT